MLKPKNNFRTWKLQRDHSRRSRKKYSEICSQSHWQRRKRNKKLTRLKPKQPKKRANKTKKAIELKMICICLFSRNKNSKRTQNQSMTEAMVDIPNKPLSSLVERRSSLCSFLSLVLSWALNAFFFWISYSLVWDFLSSSLLTLAVENLVLLLPNPLPNGLASERFLFLKLVQEFDLWGKVLTFIFESQSGLM